MSPRAVQAYTQRAGPPTWTRRSRSPASPTGLPRRRAWSTPDLATTCGVTLCTQGCDGHCAGRGQECACFWHHTNRLHEQHSAERYEQSSISQWHGSSGQQSKLLERLEGRVSARDLCACCLGTCNTGMLQARGELGAQLHSVRAPVQGGLHRLSGSRGVCLQCGWPW